MPLNLSATFGDEAAGFAACELDVHGGEQVLVGLVVVEQPVVDAVFALE